MKRYQNTTQFYNGKDWADCKAQVIQERLRDGALYCEKCGKLIVKGFNPNARNNKGAIVFHHKIYLTNQNVNDASISINPKNIAVLHWQCHNEVHNRFNGIAQKVERKVYIVTGAPCSGKSTWVKEHIQEGDVLLDMDDIWQALGGLPRYAKPNSIKALVFNIRNTMKEQIAKGVGTWRNAYIIDGKLYTPIERKNEAERYRAHNVEIVTMDATREECLNRLLANPKGRDIKAYESYINEYYDSYIEEVTND